MRINAILLNRLKRTAQQFEINESEITPLGDHYSQPRFSYLHYQGAWVWQNFSTKAEGLSSHFPLYCVSVAHQINAIVVSSFSSHSFLPPSFFMSQQNPLTEIVQTSALISLPPILTMTTSLQIFQCTISFDKVFLRAIKSCANDSTLHHSTFSNYSLSYSFSTEYAY